MQSGPKRSSRSHEEMKPAQLGLGLPREHGEAAGTERGRWVVPMSHCISAASEWMELHDGPLRLISGARCDAENLAEQLHGVDVSKCRIVHADLTEYIADDKSDPSWSSS